MNGNSQITQWRIDVSIAQQLLTLTADGQDVSTDGHGDRGKAVIQQWPISTALNGVGELNGSGCTPRGQHIIRAKIGDGEPSHAVFVGRRPTGEIYTSELGSQCPHRDWILTRILWLSGCQPGYNRLRNADGECVDSMQRYIYIHGTPDTELMGVPKSHGCIRMRNADVLSLYAQVPVGTSVIINV